jgi:hypothetical protein
MLDTACSDDAAQVAVKEPRQADVIDHASEDFVSSHETIAHAEPNVDRYRSFRQALSPHKARQITVLSVHSACPQFQVRGGKDPRNRFLSPSQDES